MKKAYLLVYSKTLGTREQVRNCLNHIPEIFTWRTDMPNSFYIISEAEPRALSTKIRACCGGRGRFMIAEIEKGKSAGWITPESWYLINNKKRKPKEE